MKRYLPHILFTWLAVLTAVHAFSQCAPCQYKTVNQVVNGDFEFGNFGFSSDYTYSTNLYPESRYAVGNNANWYHGSFYGTDKTTGSGRFMVVNGATTPGANVWCQTIPVIPNTDYNFSTWVSSVHPSNPALLQFSINGVQLGNVFEAPNSRWVWEEFFVNWNSGSNLTATICIVNQTTAAGGNDFGLDDISFAPCLPYTIVDRPLAGNDTTICSGESVNLGIPGSSGFSTQWEPAGMFTNPNALEQTLTLTNTTSDPITYTFTLTTDSAGLGCIVQEEVEVTVNPIPEFSLGNDTAVCEGPLRLEPSVPSGALFSWTDGSDQSYLDVTESGIYGLDITVLGCTFSDFIEVRVDTTPVFDLGPDLEFCEGESVTINAPLAGTWNDSSILPTYVSTETETISLEVINGTCSYSDTLETTENPLPTVDLGADTVLCEGPFTITPNVSPGALLTWSTGESSPTIDIAYTDTIVLDASLLTCENSDTIIVTIDTLPVFDLGPDLEFCEGESATINAPLTGTWNDGSILPTYVSTETETISLEVINGTCSYSDTLETTENPLPTVDLGVDTVLCEGPFTINPSVSAGSILSWSTGESSPTIDVAYTDTIILDASLLTCENSDTIIVTIDTLPVFDLGPDLEFCEGESVTINAPLAGTWNDGSILPTYVSTETETISLEVINGTCTYSDTVETSENPLPTVDLGTDTVLCEGPFTINPSVSAGSVLSWSTGESSPTIDIAYSDTIILDASLLTCENSDTIIVTIDTLPVFDLGPDLEFCEGESITINAPLAGTWNDSSILPTYVSTETETISLEVINGTCWYSDTLETTENPFPTVDLGADTVLCEGPFTINPSVSAGSVLSWSTGESSPTIDVAYTDTIILDASLLTCENSDTIIVTIDTLPVFDLGPDLEFCEGESVTLNAPLAGTWNDGSILPTYVSTETETISLEVINGTCIYSDTVETTENPLPTVDLGTDTVLCEGPFTINPSVSAGSILSWSTGESSPTIDVAYTDTIILDASLLTCENSDTIIVTIDTLPVFDLGPDLEFCEGESVTINAPLAGTWNDGSILPTYVSAETETISLEVINGTCSYSDTVETTENPLPTVDLGLDTVLCEGPFTINPSVSPGSVLSWSTGESSPTIDVAYTDTIILDASLLTCENSDTIIVTIDTLPVFDLGPDLEFCEGESATINAPLTGTWNDGSILPTYVSTETETISLEVINGTCSFSDTVETTENPLPNVDLGVDTVLCEGPFTINPSVSAGSVLSWSTGESSPTIDIAYTDTIVLDASLLTCENSDTIIVTIDTLPVFDLGPDLEFCEGESVTINAPLTGTWNDGSILPTYVSTETETISLEVINGTCSFSDTVETTENPLPNVDLGVDTVLCEGPFTINPSVSAGSVLSWSTGESSPTIDVAYTDTIILDASLLTCENSDTIIVTIDTLPVFDLGPDLEFCEGESITINAPLAGTWNDGSILPTYVSTETETISLEVINGTCSYSDTVETKALEYPEFSLGPDTVLCNAVSYVLEQPMPGLWNNELNAPSIKVTQDTLIQFHAWNAQCETVDEISITFESVAALALPTDTTTCSEDSVRVEIPLLPNELCIWSDAVDASIRYLNQPGLYWVEKYTPNCAVRDTMQLDTAAQIHPTTPDSLFACEDNPLTYTYPLQANESLIWDNSSTNPTRTFNASGIYWADVTNGYCVTRDTLVYHQDTVPSLSLPPNLALCEGDTLVLATNPILNYQYTWNDGTPGPTRQTYQAETLNLTAVNGNCEQEATTAVWVDTLPVINLPDTVLACFGESPTLNAGTVGLWSTGATAQEITATQTGWYRITATNGTCTVSDSCFVFMAALPAAENPVLALCSDDAQPAGFTQDYSPYNFKWTDNQSANPNRIFPAVNDTVAYTYNDSLCTVGGAVRIAATQKPNILVPDSVHICAGDSFRLVAQVPPGFEVRWEDTQDPNPVRFISTPGSYRLVASNGVCNATDTCVLETSNPPQIIDHGVDSICQGDTVTYTLPNITGFETRWLDGSTDTVALHTTGSIAYRLYSDVCERENQFELAVFEAPEITMTEEIWFCEGDSVRVNPTISSPLAYSATWNTGTTDANAVWIAEPGSYTISVHHAFCSSSDSLVAHEDSIPEINLPDSLFFCEGLDTAISFPTYSHYQYNWDGDFFQGPRRFTAPGNYGLSVVNNTCLATDTLHVTELRYPEISLPSEMVFCEDDSVLIQPSIVHYTLWQWEETGNRDSVFYTAENLTLLATNRFCERSDSILLQTDTIPYFDLGLDTAFCAGETVTITAPQSGTWQSGSTDLSYTTGDSETLVYTVTNGQCSYTDTMETVQKPLPVVQLPNDTALCEGPLNITGSATPGSSLNWSTGATSATISVAATETLWLQAELNGCYSADTIQVAIDTLPVFDPFTDTVLCEGTVLTYSLELPYPYYWRITNTEVLQTQEPGTYRYYVTNGTCTDSGYYTINYQEPVSLHFPDSLICSDSPITYNLQAPGYTFTVNGNAADSAITTATAGSYLITATNGVCTVSENFTLEVEEKAVLNLGNNRTVCSNETVTLAPVFPDAYSFEWMDGSPQLPRLITNEGTYEARIFGARCSSSDRITITHVQQPRFELSQSVTLCDGDSLLLMPQRIQNAREWMWSDLGEVPIPDRYVDEPGVFTLTAFNGDCQYSDDIRVDFQRDPFRTFRGQGTACEDQALIFDLLPDPEYNYLFEGEVYTDDQIYITEAGDYPLLVNANGCSFSDTIFARFLPYPELDIVPSAHICETDSFRVTVTPESDVTYRWNDNLVDSSRWIYSAGTYVITASRRMCNSRDTVVLTEDTIPQYLAADSIIWCSNAFGNTPFQLNTPYDFRWHHDSNQTISIDSAGWKHFTLTNGLCSNQDSLIFISNPLPTPMPMAKTACAGDTLDFVIDVPDSYSVLWSDGTEGNSFTSTQSQRVFAVYEDGICKDSIMALATFNPLPNITALPDVRVCEGNEYVLTYTPDSNDVAQWVNTFSNTQYTGNSITATAPEDTSVVGYVLWVTDSLTGCEKDTTFDVGIDVHPTVTTEPRYVSCNAPVVITVETNGNRVVWADSTIGTSRSVRNSGWYPFTVFQGLCSVQDSVQAYVVNQPPIELGPDTFICKDESYVLDAGVPVAWSTGDFARSITVTEEGLYSMFIGAEGCEQRDSVYVEKYDLPEIIVQDTVACEGAYYQVPESFRAYDITWYGVPPNANNEIRKAGIYSFKASGQCGDSTYSFSLTYENCLYSLFIPSAFTPNSDGNNELFKAIHEGFDKVRLQIYDRWGELIFDEIGEDPGWDGTYQGNLVQIGVYNVVFYGFYNDENGKEQRMKDFGMVTVVR